jgi:hypothetical protein
MNRAGPLWHRWRVKRLEREMADLLKELDAVYAQLEIAYHESEEASGIVYIRRARTFDDFPECERDNVIPLRPHQ